MIENGDACEDDYSIKLSVAVVSIQWTNNKGSSESWRHIASPMALYYGLKDSS